MQNPGGAPRGARGDWRVQNPGGLLQEGGLPRRGETVGGEKSDQDEKALHAFSKEQVRVECKGRPRDHSRGQGHEQWAAAGRAELLRCLPMKGDRAGGGDGALWC